MVGTLVQQTDAYLDAAIAGDIVLPAAPTAGNVLTLVMWGRSGDVSPDAIPDGFIVDAYEVTPGFAVASWAIAHRLVEVGDPDTWESPAPSPVPGRHAWLGEWSGVGPPDDAVSFLLPAGTYGSPQTISPDGNPGDLILAVFGIMTDIPGRETQLDGSMSELIEDWVAAVGGGPYASVGYVEQLGSAEAIYLNTSFHDGAALAINLPLGAVDPGEPPVDPGYEPPDVGRAILEIYVHDEDASRWGVATWATGPATGDEGVWSAAGWQDVTPQGVRAHVSWGASRPERGILAQQEAQSWLVETYDPDRKLDPGNPDSPYAPQLVSGVPIRISNAMSGSVIRTGVIDRIRYRYKRPEYRGTITASSTIAVAYRAEVPVDSILGDTLRERFADALAAAGIAIGGIPILASTATEDNYPDLPLSPQLEDASSLWEHLRLAAEEVLWVVYEDAAGTLLVRPWGGPLDRGREITYANLEDLESSTSEDGVYSVVRVQPADPDDPPIERVAAPLPRYGRIVYERRETTIDPEAWADALLADRAWPGVTWTPGVIWCFDAAEVAYFSTLELMERVHVVVPGVVDVTGTILGMELWVEQRDETKARWLFLPRLSTDGATSLGITTLVADDDGSPLVDDEGDGDYLEYEG